MLSVCFKTVEVAAAGTPQERHTGAAPEMDQRQQRDEPYQQQQREYTLSATAEEIHASNWAGGDIERAPAEDVVAGVCLTG